MEQNIKELPENFIGVGEVSGFEFTQVAFTELGYIYKVECNGKIHYETFRKETTPVCIDFEKKVYSTTEFKVIYPKSNKFGISAWTFQELEAALNKLNSYAQAN